MDNAGIHLVHFVRLWGPLWAWSCFAFEDANAMVLQSVHGTGNVVHQIVKIKEPTAMLRQAGKTEKVCKIWTKTTKVSNCEVVGTCTFFHLCSFIYFPRVILVDIDLFGFCYFL